MTGSRPDASPPDGAIVCPLLGLYSDRASHLAAWHPDHRCWAGTRPVPIERDYQVGVCTTAAYPSCEAYRAWASGPLGAAHGAPPVEAAAGSAAEPVPASPPASDPAPAFEPPAWPRAATAAGAAAGAAGAGPAPAGAAAGDPAAADAPVADEVAPSLWDHAERQAATEGAPPAAEADDAPTQAHDGAPGEAPDEAPDEPIDEDAPLAAVVAAGAAAAGLGAVVAASGSGPAAGPTDLPADRLALAGDAVSEPEPTFEDAEPELDTGEPEAGEPEADAPADDAGLAGAAVTDGIDEAAGADEADRPIVEQGYRYLPPEAAVGVAAATVAPRAAYPPDAYARAAGAPPDEDVVYAEDIPELEEPPPGGHGILWHIGRAIAIAIVAIVVLAALVGVGYLAGRVLVRPGAGPSPTPIVTPAPATAAPTATPTPTAAPTPTPEPTATPKPTKKPKPTATPKPQATTITYRVRSGDTLYTIAAEYGTTIKAIVEANGITDPSVIVVGQELLIPIP